MTTDVPGRRNSFEFLSTRTVVQALQALSTSTKQAQNIRISILSSGVQVRCEDSGKVSQGLVRFPLGFFTKFNFSGSPSTFSVCLSELLDALRVFACLPDVTVCVTETVQHLVLETAETDDRVTVSMYAHLAIMTTSVTTDFADCWQVPATEFLTSALIIKEAIEDLEWPQGSVQVTVIAEPFQVILAARGSVGRLDITFSRTQLRQCTAHQPRVSHRYPYKFMRLALSGIASMKSDVSSMISIDANGLLKVVHMLPAGKGMSQSAHASQGSLGSDVVLTHYIQCRYEEDAEHFDDG